jgi:hypothetical protein
LEDDEIYSNVTSKTRKFVAIISSKMNTLEKRFGKNIVEHDRRKVIEKAIANDELRKDKIDFIEGYSKRSLRFQCGLMLALLILCCATIACF